MPDPIEFDGISADAQKAAEEFMDVVKKRVQKATGVHDHQRDDLLDMARTLTRGVAENGIKTVSPVADVPDLNKHYMYGADLAHTKQASENSDIHFRENGQFKVYQSQVDLFVFTQSTENGNETLCRIWYDLNDKQLRVEGDMDKGAKEFAKYLSAHFQAAIGGRDGL